MNKKILNKSKEKTNSFVQEHKMFIRKKLLFPLGNFATFVSILPFILGFSQFLNQKYGNTKNNLFFEQNLPGVSFATQKLNWDTFQYLLKQKNIEDIFIQPDKNTITWSDKDIIISTQVNELCTPSAEKNLISYITPAENKIESQITAKWYKFLLYENNRTLLKFLSQHLDEIPLKIQSSSTFPTSTKPLSFAQHLNVSSSEKIKTFVKKYQQIKAKNLLSNSFLVGYKVPNSDTLNTIQTNRLGKPSLNLFSLKQQKEFFENDSSFKQELRNVFLNTNCIPSNSLRVEDMNQAKLLLNQKTTKDYENFIMQSQLLTNDEVEPFHELIRQIDQISLPKPLNTTRLMSGYVYPDMSLTEVFCFLIQKNTSKTWNLKISLPASYLFPQLSKIKQLSPPSYLIGSKQLVLRNKENLQNNILYQGPSVLLDNETGFDWKIGSKNNQSATEQRLNPISPIFSDTNKAAAQPLFTLRAWLESSLGVNNPSNQFLKNFFGIFDSPKNVVPNVTKTVSEENYYLQNFSVYRNGVILNPIRNSLPFSRSFQLPTISSEDWENKFLKLINTDEGTEVEYKTVLLPIFEVRLPKLISPSIPFGYKNTLDFEFIHPFRSGLNSSNIKSSPKNLNQLTYSLPGSTFQDYGSFTTSLASGNYRKSLSIFQKNATIFFSDIWEPLTFNSWLITAQMGFAFLVLKILKALADNYTQELLVYFLDLVAGLGFLDDNLRQEIEILMGQREKGFRIIPKTTKNFHNIAGIEKILPEIVEIVWFLRNSGREFSISKTLPRGILLIGPPGTGKTLLVQAIAGEARVPVLALSGSSLLEPGESGAVKLQILFEEARKEAPCIVFIDEVDSLAQRREQVIQNPMGADELLESLETIQPVTGFSPTSTSGENFESFEEFTAALYAQQDMQKEKLRILMQLLIELDGIQGREGVVVIGATNRPEILDQAILRPGRFDRIVDIALPNPEKRREILDLYSENLGVDSTVSWDYLIHRTAGYSAADLAGIMNQSTLHAILKNSQHTIQTIEYGIDRITTIGLEKPYKAETQQFLSTQVAYYQAGKILLSALLEHHPSTVVTYLWPRRANVRGLKINENLQKYFFHLARRIEVEHRIIGCYAGKASEILFLQDSFQLHQLSDLGTEDMQFAQNLIKYAIENWYFYRKTIALQQNTHIISLFNEKEYQNTIAFDNLPYFDSVLQTQELSLINKGEDFGNILYEPLDEEALEQNPQVYYPTASWQYQVSTQFELATRVFSNWYRLYLPDPRKHERNLEWIPPDEYYHRNNINDKLSESVRWNDVSNVQVDYKTHSLILESFNKAITLLDQHREILDLLAYELLHSEILRAPEIEKILENFNFEQVNSKNSIESAENFGEFQKDIYLSWGENSRRPKTYWIDLESIKEQSQRKND